MKTGRDGAIYEKKLSRSDIEQVRIEKELYTLP